MAAGALSGQWFSSFMDLKFELPQWEVVGTEEVGLGQKEVFTMGVHVRGISYLEHFLSFPCFLA